MAKGHKRYLEAAKFGMRREEDIGRAMQSHLQRLAKSVAKAKPQNISLKMRVYWGDGSITGSGSKCKPEYVLQEVLSGKDEDVFRQLGQGTADAIKEMGSAPVGVTISVETLLADEITPGSDRRKIRGLPVLLVAGRTANGKSHAVTLPLALDNRNIRYIPTNDMIPPPKIVAKLSALRASAVDFLSPFFESLKQ